MNDNRSNRKLHVTLVFLASVVLVVVAAGVVVYRAQGSAMRREAEKDLSRIAAVTVQRIRSWREDNLTDGKLLAEDLAPEISQLIATPSPSTREAFEIRMQRAAAMHDHAAILVVDRTGKQVLSHGSVPITGADLAGPVEQTFARREPVAFDLHGTDSGVPYLVVVAPVPELPDLSRTSGHPVAVVLVSDLSTLLLPTVRAWTAPKDTAELFLVRADGDDAVVLTDLRFGSDIVTPLHIPLDQPHSPAATAARGHEGFMHGVDYRARSVAAVTMAVPHTPWALVAKMDTDEAYSTWRSRSSFLVSVIAGVAVFLGGIGAALWYHHRKAHYKALFQAERILREQNERHSVTLQSIGDAVISTDATGRVEFLNPAAESLTGWDSAEATGRSISEVFRIVHAVTGLPAEIPVDRVLAEGIVVGLANHTTLIARDGTVRQIADAAAPIRSDTGAVVGVVLVFRDVTESYRAQRALQDSEARLRAAASNLDGVLYVLNSDLQFTLSLGKRLTALDLKENEVIGTSLYDFLNTGDPDHPLIVHHQRALTGEVVTMESTHNEVTFLTTLSPLTDQYGTVSGIVGVAFDITDRKEMEEQLRDALNEKTHLLRELYHRTRNNMQVIASTLSLQSGSTKNNEVRIALEENAARIDSMALVHEMLYESQDLSRINLADYIRRLASAVGATYRQSDIQMRVFVDAMDVPVLFDTAVPCGMVVSELFTNAQKHAFPNGETGTVTIRLRRVPEGSIELTVSDDGVGLPAGLDVRSGDSAGLQTIIALVEDQLDGSISFDGTRGTSCEIRFSDDQYEKRV